MKNIDRITLLERIGRYLQERMTTSDINIYLGGFGISANETSVPSKRVYVKKILASVENNLLIRIAADLELSPPPKVVYDSPEFWREKSFKLFISHHSSAKLRATNLQKDLNQYGISSFVAHEDIEPTREWLIEIERALQSMDGLVALVCSKFDQSKWTHQEVGWALGRNLLVIPLRVGADPCGFLGKYQGVQTNNKSRIQVARNVCEILATHSLTKDSMNTALEHATENVVEDFVNSTSWQSAKDSMSRLENCLYLSPKMLERILEALELNPQVAEAFGVPDRIKLLLQKHTKKKVA